jgi:hypothetical protein
MRKQVRAGLLTVALAGAIASCGSSARRGFAFCVQMAPHVRVCNKRQMDAYARKHPIRILVPAKHDQ